MASEKRWAESLPKLEQWPPFLAVIRLLKQAQRTHEIWFSQKFRILRSLLCNFPIVGLDVWEYISPPLESTGTPGVINYKFWKALEMTFHLVHLHFSALNRWAVIRIFVKILEARLRYRNFSRIFACKNFSAGLSILIMKTSRNSRCWVKWAFPWLKLLELFACTLKCCQQFLLWFSKTLTKTLMRKYLLVVFDFYQAAWKIHQSFGGKFTPWSFAGFIKKLF